MNIKLKLLTGVALLGLVSTTAIAEEGYSEHTKQELYAKLLDTSRKLCSLESDMAADVMESRMVDNDAAITTAKLEKYVSKIDTMVYFSYKYEHVGFFSDIFNDGRGEAVADVKNKWYNACLKIKKEQMP